MRLPPLAGRERAGDALTAGRDRRLATATPLLLAGLLALFVLATPSLAQPVRPGDGPGRPGSGPSAADPADGAVSAEPGESSGPAGETGRAVFPFSTAPVENLEIEARLDSLHIMYGHGLPSETIRVEHTDEGPYISLGDLGRITGRGYRWNPETWKGSFVVDSIDVAFSLDSQIFWVRGAAVQLPAPVRYREEQVRLPLGVIDGILGPLLRDRCRWDPLRGTLELAGPRPLAETLSLAGDPPLAALQIGPAQLKDLRLRWDPLGQLTVEVQGIWPGPRTFAVTGRTRGIRARAPRATGRGFEVALELEPEWVGVRLRPDRTQGTVAVELTGSTREVQRGRFEPLATWAVDASTRLPGILSGRTILLEIPPPPPGGEATLDCLLGLSELLRGVLEREFGHALVVIQDRTEEGALRSPAGLPETPGVPSGDCWIGLRLEVRQPGREGEVSLVVPQMVPRREVMRGGALEAVDAAAAERALEAAAATGAAFERLAPWGQAARPREAESLRFARLLADHLDYRWADRPIRIQPRPARIFRGLGVPAVLIYPASLDDEVSMRALCDPVLIEALVQNLAFAIDEFLMSQVGREE